MQGLGDLPVELLFIITDQISRKDILNLRLCAPRNILPFFDVIVFREIYLPIDTSDDLERLKREKGKTKVALQRLLDISQSRIVKHVRILVFRVARLYSLITAFGIFLFAFSAAQLTSTFVDERLAAPRKAPLFQHTTASGSVTGWLQRAMGSMRLVKPVKPQDPSTPSSWTTHPSKRNYAAKLAKALQALVSVADMLTTIRLAQSFDYNSRQDIEYPIVYGRALTRLFDALLGVTFAPSVCTTLDIHDCPLMHLRESGLFLDEEVIEKVAAKFSRISLETHSMGYIPEYQATKQTQLGQQLVDGLRASGDRLTSLSIRGAPWWKPKRLIVSEDNYPSLTHITLSSIWISSAVFVPFISSRLPQLISLHASDIHFDRGEIRWREAFDVWRAVKKSIREQGKNLKLEDVTLTMLYGPHDTAPYWYNFPVDDSVISLFVKDILASPKCGPSPIMHRQWLTS